MHPVLLRIGSFTIYTYGLLVAVGIAVVFFLALRRTKRLKYPSEQIIYNLAFTAIIAGLIGARTIHVAAEWGYYRNHLTEIFLLRRGGLAIQGGILFGLVFGTWYLYLTKTSPLPVLDSFFLYLPVGQAIGRLGCFFNGCCYGRPSSLPWAIKFPFLEARVHPTELYYLAAHLGLFFVLNLFSQEENIQKGELTAWYFILYGFIRSLLDNFRGDLLPGFLGLYATQWYAILFTIFGAIMLTTLKINNRKRFKEFRE